MYQPDIAGNGAAAERLSRPLSEVDPAIADIIRREEDRQDRRITRLLLTPEGAAVLHQMAAGRREVLAEVLQQLEAEELDIVERAFELVALGVQRASPSAAAALLACSPAGAAAPANSTVASNVLAVPAMRTGDRTVAPGNGASTRITGLTSSMSVRSRSVAGTPSPPMASTASIGTAQKRSATRQTSEGP